MKSYHITNALAVDRDAEEQISDNGKSGDARVALCRAPIVRGGAGLHYYLQTNGDPVAIGEHSDHEDLVAAAADLGVSTSELVAQVSQ